MTRILIADEHETVRLGLRKHLEAQPNWEVVGEAADGREAIQKAAEMKPDVAVLAYALPFINGIEATAEIRKQLPSTEVVIYTAHKIEHLLAYFLKAGARGIVLKSEPISHLIAAIRTVTARKPYFADTPSLWRMLERPIESSLPLTARERSVVQLIADGNTNKQIARALDIGLKTVETHRLNIMNKLELGSSAELVRYAVRNQIVEARAKRRHEKKKGHVGRAEMPLSLRSAKWTNPSKLGSRCDCRRSQERAWRYIRPTRPSRGCRAATGGHREDLARAAPQPGSLSRLLPPAARRFREIDGTSSGQH